MAGKAGIIIAGGMEHMTHVPLGVDNQFIKPNMELMANPKYSKFNMNVSYNMGLTAEKLAKLRKISRDEMDEYSYNSHKRAAKAYEDGFMKGEIMPVTVNGNTISSDLGIRTDTTLEQIKSLKPAYSEDGIITAANSSSLNDGASMVMLMSGKKLKEYGNRRNNSTGTMVDSRLPERPRENCKAMDRRMAAYRRPGNNG